jgi:hypothetical protein
MLLLPVPDFLSVLGIAEVILVLRLSQPSPLKRTLSSFAAVGSEAVTLAMAGPAIRNKETFAVQALVSGTRRLHRFLKSKEPVSEIRKTRPQENPARTRVSRTKKEEDFSADPSKKIPAKKIHSKPAALYPFHFGGGISMKVTSSRSHKRSASIESGREMIAPLFLGIDTLRAVDPDLCNGRSRCWRQMESR